MNKILFYPTLKTIFTLSKPPKIPLISKPLLELISYKIKKWNRLMRK